MPLVSFSKDKPNDTECEKFKFYTGCGIEEAQKEEQSYSLNLICTQTEHLGFTFGKGHIEDLQGTTIDNDLITEPFQLQIGDRTCKRIYKAGHSRIYSLEKSEDFFNCLYLNQYDDKERKEVTLKESKINVNRFAGTAILHWIDRKIYENNPLTVKDFKTHIGEGLTKKTAKINDNAVRACSPPDNKVIDCNLLPGGETNISRPASSGSSESTNSSFALPPPKSLIKTLLNFLFTLPKASINLSLPF